MARDALICMGEMFGAPRSDGVRVPVVLLDPAGLGECLTREARANTGGRKVLVIDIDVATPWSLIAEIVSMADGFERSGFVLEREWRATPPLPWPKRLEGEASEISGFPRGLTRVEEAIGARWHESIYARCPSARRVFDSLSIDFDNPAPYGSAIDRILDELPRALEQCDCAADPLEVRFHLWALMGRHDVRKALVMMVVHLAHGRPGAARISGPADARWEEMVPKIAEQLRRDPDRPVDLVVEAAN